MSLRDTIFLTVFVVDPIALACLDVYLVRRGRARLISWWAIAVSIVSILIWFLLYKGSDIGVDPLYDGPRPYSPLLREHIWSPLFYFGLPAAAVGYAAAKMRLSLPWGAQVGIASVIGILSLAPAYVFGLASALIASGHRGF